MKLVLHCNKLSLRYIDSVFLFSFERIRIRLDYEELTTVLREVLKRCLHICNSLILRKVDCLYTLS